MIRLIIFVVAVLILAIGVGGNPCMQCLGDSTVIRVPKDYSTIKSALAAAIPGDTILVSEGIYPEGEITVSQSSITLVTNGTVVVDGLNVGNVFSVYGNNVTIKGFSIINSKFQYPYCGIQLISAQGCTIEANNVTNCYYGIELAYSRNNTVVGNAVTDTCEPIELFHSEYNNITGNNIESNEYGIPIAYSSGNMIIHNNVSDNQKGAIALWHSNSNIILENDFAGGWLCVWVNASNYNNFTRNVALGGNFGFWLWESQNCILRYNNITDNKYNFGAWGENTTFFMHDIDVSNIVNGKPMYYLLNQSDMIINESTFPKIGFLAVVNSTNIIVENLSLTGNIEGLFLAGITNATLQNLNVSNNYEGILLVDSEDTSLINNCVSNNMFGIRLFNSAGNFLRNNNMTKNRFNFGVEGEDLHHYVQDIDASNFVDGKPICYLVNEWSKHVPLDAGFVAAVNCTDITAQDLNLTNNGQGILFAYTTNSTIQNSNITNNWLSGICLWSSNNNGINGNTITNSTWYGVQLHESEKNSVRDNTIINNWRGMLLFQSNNNTIYHNNFINNTEQLQNEQSENTWDHQYPDGGNYWSDYTGADEKSSPNQDQTGSDGIGDKPYVIDGNNIDHYPLMGFINIFNVGVWNGTPCQVYVISNSTVSNFQLNAMEKILSFNVTGETGLGFCRATIPNVIVQEMWKGNYSVLVGDEAPSEIRNWTDNTNVYIYFTFQLPNREVTIISEFPLIIILLLFVVLSTVAAILAKEGHLDKRRLVTG